MTPAQLATLKAAILAETDPEFVTLRTEGATGAMANWFNVERTPAMSLWRKEVPVADLINAIDLDAYTPNSAAAETLIDQGRSFRAQIKQVNLQILLQGRDELDTSFVNVRKGLRDAVINIPTGAGGADKNAAGSGGVSVLSACVRNATRGEAVFATGPFTTGAVSAYVSPFRTLYLSNETVLAALAAA